MSTSQGSNHVPRVPFSPQAHPSPFAVHIPPSLFTMGGGVHQHQQYSGISNVPGMQSMNHVGGTSSLQNLQSMSGFQSFSNLPGIQEMPSLLHPPTESVGPSLQPTILSQAPPPPPLLYTSQGPPLHPPHPHAATGTRPSVGLSTSYASHFPPNALLSGTIEKPRKSRKPRPVYANLGTGEDGSAIIVNGNEQMTSHVEGPISSSAPVYEADGIQFKVLDQLPDAKIQRLRSEKIKPIEQLKLSDIKAYNRNQLRAYCSVYGIRRKKKADMERDMARYAGLFHPNDSNYDLSKFEPTEYAEGPIPRRKVPVTKEQKEQAAGDFKQLTNALHQRPLSGSTSSGMLAGLPFVSLAPPEHGGHGLGTGVGIGGGAYHHHGSVMMAGRLPDIHGTEGHEGVGSGALGGPLHGVGVAGLHQIDEGVQDGGNRVGHPELMTMPEMHVPQHLLSISQQIGEEY